MAEPMVRLWERLGLAQRLLLVVACIVLLSAMGAVALSARLATQDARDALAHEFEQQAETLRLAITPVLSTRNPDLIQATLREVQLSPSVVRIGFRDVSDTADYSESSPVALQAPLWFARWCGTQELEGTLPVLANGTYYGILSLGLTPIPTINRAWQRVVRELAILGLLLGLVTLGVWLVLWEGLKPLGVLAQGNRALSGGDFSVRLPERGSPELRESAAGFNRMAAALHQLVGDLQANNLALAQSEQYLQVTLRSIGDAVITTDAQGRVTMLNPVAETLTGWREAEARGRPVAEVFHIINEHTRQVLSCPVTQVLASGALVGLAEDTLLVARDGQERPIADSGAPIRLHDSAAILGVAMVFRDQTTERERLRALEEREQRYASLAQAAPVGIMRMADPKNVVYCNDRLGQILGMSQEAIARENTDWIGNHAHPADKARVEAAFQRGVRDKVVIRERFRMGRPDGSLAWIHVVMAPEQDGQGFVAIVSDISEEQLQVERIDHLSKLYATLTQINHAVIQSRSQEALYQEICRVAVQVGGVSAAWIFTLDLAAGRLALGAAEGSELTALLGPDWGGISLYPDDGMAESLSVRVALGGRRLYNNNCLDNIRAAGLPHLLQGRLGSSLAAVPVRRSGQVVAVLGLLAGEANYFSDDMLALIDEIGEDISYALDSREQERLRRDAEARLRHSEERLRLALEASGQGCYEVDVVAQRVFLDSHYAQILGFPPQPREMALADYMAHCFPSPPQRAQAQESLRNSTSDNFSYEQQFITPAGEPRWILRRGAVVERKADGAILRVLATAADVTARHQMEDHLRMMAMVFENSRDAVLITDTQANILMVNGAFTKLTGYRAEEVLGKNPRVIRSGLQDASFYRDLWQHLLSTGFWHGEIWNQRKNGEHYPSLSSISAVRRPDGELTHFIGLSRDITQQKASEERIIKLAYRDSLTDLPNRLLLRDRADQGLAAAHREGHSLALLFLDLDHFKNINDSLGHAVGDRLLVEAARRMRLTLREMDTVGRLGGDEFLLLLPDGDADAAAHVAQKLLVEIAKPVLVGEHSLTVTPSIGISLYPKDGRSFDDLMRSADAAMYRAKERGRNAYHFADAEMNQAVLQRLVLESSLRQAIHGNELVLVYQPQFNITGGLSGVEALLRWNHPEMGFVSPGQFIPVAEDCGLIEPIGAWVLGEVCRQVVRWREQGVCPGRVGVNFSARQFAAPNLIQVVDQALADSGLKGDCLEAEITESLLIGDLDSVLEVLHAFKERGIHVAVDDFGTGYSSLSYLKRFPIDRLKIDQSFVRDLESDCDDRAIATAVVTLGHSLGMRVIAEGVETPQQLAILNKMGCDEVQGYHLGRPMPPEAIAAILPPYSLGRPRPSANTAKKTARKSLPCKTPS